MDHYGIQDPYGKSKQYYIDHYVCLWEVTESEVVGHWEWEDLAEKASWYEGLIKPAFMEHERRSLFSSKPPCTNPFDLSTLFAQVSRMDSNSDSDSSERFIGGFEDDGPGWSDGGTDTDDEVEEANAADDMIKVIEGDWRW